MSDPFTDPNVAITSIQQSIGELQAKIIELEQRLAQISELAHLEAEQPSEPPPA